MIEENIQFDPSKGPYELGAEMSFLGSLIICTESAVQHRMRSMLWADAFFLKDHGEIFTAICGVLDSGKPLDVTTLRAEMKQRGTHEAVGGDGYLGKILYSVPSASHGEHYGTIIEELALRRMGAEVFLAAANRLMMPALDGMASSVIESAINKATAIRTRRSRVELFSLADIIGEFLSAKDEKKSPALLTGIEVIDRFSGLFAFGKYTIIGGRPSMGKSTLVRWLLELWARAGTPVGLVAVEEDRSKIAGNYLSSVSGVENHVIAYRELDKQQRLQTIDAASQLSVVPWYGVDTAFSTSEVCTAVEMLATEKQCRVIAVDHIHLISPDHRGDNEQREVKEISRRLKEVGKRHNVVLIAAAQLSRPSEKVKVPPSPTLTDLRASGAIEEHADAVAFLHREDYYRQGHPTHCCEIIVAKNRNGRRGKSLLYEELSNQRFRAPTSEEERGWSSDNEECPV